MDLKRLDKIDALGPTIYQRWQKLDILVGNAGILGPLSPLGHVAAEAWDEVIAINLTANWRLIRTLDPLLRMSDAGRAIFVSSGAAVRPRAYWGPYAVSKAAVMALTRVLALENRERGVRFNCVVPAIIDTVANRRAMPAADASSWTPAPAIARIVVFLLSPESAAVTGAFLPVDGKA